LPKERNGGTPKVMDYYQQKIEKFIEMNNVIADVRRQLRTPSAGSVYTIGAAFDKVALWELPEQTKEMLIRILPPLLKELRAKMVVRKDAIWLYI